jgi:UDP-glucose:(heptosyl)LPS alpha-1,3-glucosyltransferase
MRIALVIEHLDSRRGGAETYIHDFATWLLAEGHAVQIVTQSAHAPPEGAEVHTINGSMKAFVAGARQRLTDLSPEVSLATGKALGMTVYQGHGGTVRGSERQNVALRSGGGGRALKRLLNCLSPKRRSARRLEAAQFADPATHFVAISRMVRQDMKTFYDVPDDRITLIYNGVDLQRFHGDRLQEDRQRIRREHSIADEVTLALMVAHNFKLKGLREQLLALGRLAGSAAPRWHLLVVGGTRRRQRPYARLANIMGIADRVTFAGAVDDTAPYYGAADVFVHPTWYDPCSLVVLEALAAGLPTLTTRYNGASELMDGRDAGVVLDAPRPVARLAEGLSALLDPARRDTMSRAARQVAEEYGQERNFREMLDVLSRAAKGKRKP